MKTHVLILCAVVAVSSLTGCKLVKTSTDGKAAATATDESGDDARIAKLVASTWSDRLVPLVRSNAVDAKDLVTAIAADLDEAGRKHGHRGSGEGSAWSFAVKGQGKIVAADRASRAAHVDVDVDGDGKADVVVQLGPVVKGSALRDLAPFYDFTAFRDQIEFAKLGRVLNDTAVKGVTIPDGDPTGKTLTFTGAVALHSATEKLLLVPIDLQVTP